MVSWVGGVTGCEVSVIPGDDGIGMQEFLLKEGREVYTECMLLEGGGAGAGCETRDRDD